MLRVNRRFQKFVNKSFIGKNDEEENDKTCETETDFEYFCEWHHKLCSLIGNLNECYKEFIAFNLLATMPQLVLILYFFTKSSCSLSDTIGTVGFVLYSLQCLYLLGMLVIVAAKINTNVR